MKPKKKTSAVAAVLASLLLLLCSVSVSRGAERNGSIEMVYELSDVAFQLYRVGVITDGGVVPADEFRKYHVDLRSENAAQTLAAYIQRDHVQPLMAGVTDLHGSVTFETLSKAVYLVIGESTSVGDTVYTVMPSLISVPTLNTQGAEEWYLRAKVKYEKHTEGETEVSCLKVWKNAGDRVVPEVQVQLLRDFEVYDTVTLNGSNSWKYRWTGLDTRYQWTVTEVETERVSRRRQPQPLHLRDHQYL